MASYPVEIRRCRHIKTNGTQCGSPALKSKELCFYHDQNRPVEAELYIDGERYSDGSIMLPPLEDAHSIQTVIRHVVQLMLTRRIDRKDAGVLLYALQIASGNLKTMQTEKAKPTQMVVEPEKAGETPLGMTPWSATGQGHDPEEGEEEETAGKKYGEEEEIEEQNPTPPPTTADEVYAHLNKDERNVLRKQFQDQEKDWIRPSEVCDYFFDGAPDPPLGVIRHIFKELDRRQHEEEEAAAENSKLESSEAAESQACSLDRGIPDPNSDAVTS
jgi:hypothetical protein